ncbi:uncharacterized protein LOC125676943 [Ostrea edulis]|uniref:uncharacterized protein LOC125676943 n=1 Tax=Ostrea edulis TaxID=37623 RepID=UPI0024AECA1F|nr:uncharacterized protein LOC125676943 [Ostrea edulis]XP_048770772.2 uncharacterized protein LOC125676943 [Ostrea edulis]XP_056013753.1 uncharacterized protein LOC125676943 [Ostrea edulis]
MQQPPPKETQITDLDHLVRLTQSANLALKHCKVIRNGYDHHFILLGHTWDSQSCQRIHFTGNYRTAVAIGGVGRVKRDQYSSDDIKADIGKGLSLIEKDDYPREVEDMAIAWSRWLKREGEKRYYVTFNNCEHLVSYILTGIAHSEQWTLATLTQRLKGDVLDILICEWKETLFKAGASLISSLYSRKLTRMSVVEVRQRVNTSSKTWTSFISRVVKKFRPTSKAVTPPNVFNTYIERFCTKYGIPLEHVAQPERFLYDIAMKIFLLSLKIVQHSFAFSVGLEICSIYQMYKVWYDKKQDNISESTYKREMLKRVIGSLYAILGTSVGCLLGFLLSTTEWNITFLFGFLGNIIFRLMASISTAALIDWVR